MDLAGRVRKRWTTAFSVLLLLTALAVWGTSEFIQEKRNDELIAAIHHKDAGAALALIRAGANPNMQDAGAGRLTVRTAMRRLIDHFRGRHVTAGSSALDLAVQGHLSSVACALLDHGALGANDVLDLPDGDPPGAYPLLAVAVRSGDYELATHLTSHGANVESRAGSNDTPLLFAAARGDLKIVTLLLGRHADPNARDDMGYGSLEVALDGDHVNAGLVTFLLDHGADPNGADDNGTVPLVRTDSPEIVAALIAHGADARGSKHPHPSEFGLGESPILHAAGCDNWAGVRLLLDHGAPVNDDAGSDTSPLHCAALHGRLAAAALLISRGARVNRRDIAGCTPLMNAAEASSLPTVCLLLAHAAAVGSKDSDGRTALFRAASFGNAAIATALLQAGASVADRDLVGETALDEAEDAENEDVAAVLRARGARSSDSAGRIPAIGHILGLRLGYAGEDEIDRRLGKGQVHIGGHSNSGRTWDLNAVHIDADGFDGCAEGYLIDTLDVSLWRGPLRSVAGFRRWGTGPWGDLRIGMTLDQARAAMRSKLPPPRIMPGTLTWIDHARGRRGGKTVTFTYTANLSFNPGLESLHIEIDAPN